MTPAAVWMEGARPKTWIASISPVAMAGAMAWKTDPCSLWIFLCLLGSALFIQIGTNYANDYFDFLKGADQDRIGPRRIMAAGLVNKNQLKIAIFFSFSISVFFTLFLVHRGGLLIALLLVLAILLGFLYTGGPFPLAYLGLGDIFVFIFFGPAATWLSYYLLTEEYAMAPLIAGIAPGALSTAILIANNLRDRISDSHAQKKTLVVRFGHIFGVLEYQAMLILSFMTPIFLGKIHSNFAWSAACGFLILPLFFSSFLLYKEKDPERIAPYLPKTAFFLSLYTVLFCICLFL
ncbi:MAG: 1,4-dihydroxy-2-naphthoate polyprenyltransferase [Simkaniaceae bacterium]